MTANDSTTRVISDSGDDIGPGQRLREAREAAQLSLTEVASRMRLEAHVLEALEGDHFERLHGPTFVRGYLSGYARLLDLPERPILEAYERHDHRPPALVSELGRKPEVHVSDFPVRMVTYVIAGLLVVLVVLWWQSRQLHTADPERADAGVEAIIQEGASSPGITEPSVPAGSPLSTGGPQATQPVADAGASAQAVQPPPLPAEAVASESAAAASEPPSQAAMIEAPAGEVRSMPAPTPPAESAIAVESSTPARTDVVDSARVDLQEAPSPAAGSTRDEPAAEANSQAQAVLAVAPASGDSAVSGGTGNAGGTETEAAPAARPAPLPGSDRLAIQLARESWVEIYDRGGGRLYYSLASEGSEVVVEGAGPMRVLLGEIEGAAVAYNGEPFDLSRYQGRSVVRFTVGELSGSATPESPAPAPAEEPLTRETPPPPAAGHENAVADAAGALAVPAVTAEPVDAKAPPASADTPPATAPANLRPDS